MYLIGIDCSISSTAIAVYDNKKDKYHFYMYSSKIQKGCGNIEYCSDRFELTLLRQDKKFKDDFHRFVHVTDELYGMIDKYMHECIIMLEGYSFASTGKQFTIGEFTALLKKKIYDSGNSFHTASPGEWKKAIVGKGNAKKDDIIDFCMKQEIISDVIKTINQHTDLKKDYIEDLCDSFCILTYLKRVTSPFT